MAQENQNCLNTFKNMHLKLHQEIDQKRLEFLREVYPLIRDWEGPLPNLRDMFCPKEIEWLLTESINIREDPAPLVDFVINTGYKDEPKVGEDGKPLLHRATAVHHAAKNHTGFIIPNLFKIYDRCDIVNYTDEDGYTHFHIACEYGCDEIVQKFLDHGVDPNYLEPKTGDSPLRLALRNGDNQLAELLLRRGANLNLANNKGETPLHCTFAAINDDDDDNNLAEMLFEISVEVNQPMQVDARDKLGNTPLHTALDYGGRKIAASLLRRGASPNATNAEGSTPLHVICKRCTIDDDFDECHDFLEKFFELNDELQQTVQIDARDKMGQTPLQLAVANFKPAFIDVLLDRGADLSSFVLPTSFETNWSESDVFGFKLSLASGILAVVERLEKRGYELTRKDILMIMELFAKHEIFEKSEELDEGWLDDEEFASTAKQIRILERDNDDDKEEEEEEAREAEDPLKSLSLYDLIRLRPEEAAKLLTYEDYLGFVYSENDVWRLPDEGPSIDASARCLCEKVARTFSRRWALELFWELTRHQLPILCCEIIIRKLKNQDLCNICLAVAGHNL